MWRVKGLLDKHRLAGTGTRILGQLRELQSLALSYQTDMEIEFFRNGEGIAYRLLTDEPLKFIRKGETVSMGDRSDFVFNEKKNLPFKITLYSSGWIEPRGVLEIQGKEGQLWIDFQSPLQIKLSEKKPLILKDSFPDRPNV